MNEKYTKEFYEELNKISESYSKKHKEYIQRVNNNEDYSELEKELNKLIKASNDLQGINVVYNK